MDNKDNLKELITDKIKKIGDQKIDLQNKNLQLESMLTSLRAELDEARKERDELTEKNKVLTMARSIEGHNEDNSEVRKRVNELVKEIDKCIALLNK